MFKKKRRCHRLSSKTQNLFLLLPYLLLVVGLVILPAAATLGIGFTKYSTIQKPTWVGLQNFKDALSSKLVLLSLKNTAIFILLAVPLRLLGALTAALLFNQRSKAMPVFRTAAYLPTIIPETAYALIWLWILNPVQGPLNILLSTLGLPAPIWLAGEQTALLAIVLVSIFQIGEGFVILTTGLESIPRAYYESAEMDGASAWQAFWQITLPLLAPWLALLLCRDILISMQNTFTPTFILTYGGPYFATTLIPLLIYELAFDYFEFGLAAAVLTLVYILIGALILAIIRLLPFLRGDDAV